MNQDATPHPEEHLVTAHTVSDPVVAELIKNQLKDEGIECQIGGEHQGGFTGTLAIEIIVREADLVRAQEIIAVHHN